MLVENHVFCVQLLTELKFTVMVGESQLLWLVGCCHGPHRGGDSEGKVEYVAQGKV